jgi:hypothetical protein
MMRVSRLIPSIALFLPCLPSCAAGAAPDAKTKAYLENPMLSLLECGLEMESVSEVRTDRPGWNINSMTMIRIPIVLGLRSRTKGIRREFDSGFTLIHSEGLLGTHQLSKKSLESGARHLFFEF